MTYFTLILVAVVLPVSLLGNAAAGDLHAMSAEAPASVAEPGVASALGEIVGSPATSPTRCCGTAECNCESPDSATLPGETPAVHSCCSQQQPLPSEDATPPVALTPRTLEQSAAPLQTSAIAWPNAPSCRQSTTHQGNSVADCPLDLLLLHCTSLT